MTEGGRANNFAHLRLLAAAMVVLGHSYVITGHAAPRLLGIEVHVLGVHIFFAISGYLITASWLHDPSPLRFAARRALRILPALWAVVLLTVLVLGPAMTRLDLPAYAAGADTRLYLWNAALAPYYALPGVFQDGRPFTAVNGSLWTLPIEAAMYALVPLLAPPAARLRRVLLPAGVVGAVAAAYVFTVLRPDQVQPVIWWNSVPFGLRFAGDFALGALAAAWRAERLPAPAIARRGAAALAAGLTAGLAALLAAVPGLQPSGVLLLVPCLTLAAALLLPALPAPRADLSYGLYLYACPVQQALLHALGPAPSPWALTAAALLIAACLAAGSWFLVERPCLALKPRHPARG